MTTAFESWANSVKEQRAITTEAPKEARKVWNKFSMFRALSPLIDFCESKGTNLLFDRPAEDEQDPDFNKFKIYGRGTFSRIDGRLFHLIVTSGAIIDEVERTLYQRFNSDKGVKTVVVKFRFTPYKKGVLNEYE